MNNLLKKISIDRLYKRQRLLNNYILWEFYKTFIKSSILDNHVVLAGGACRNVIKEETINDFDLFILGNEDEQKKIYENIRSKFSTLVRFEKIFECKEGKLTSYLDRLTNTKIQLIKEQPFDNVENLLDSFDFNATRFALWDNHFYFSRAGIKDIKNKELSLYKLTYPNSTIRRVFKYKNRGYDITKCMEDILRTLLVNNAEFFDDQIKRVYID